MPARIHKLPVVGEIIDDMTVMELYRDRNKKVRVKCRCNICGRDKDIDFITGILTHTRTTHVSCGKDRIKGNGLASSNVRFHTIWMAMRGRTNNPNDSQYKYYGGRGIKSDEFEFFVDFYDKMHDSYLEAIEKYGDESLVSLDRINPDGDYTVDNCRWISLSEQKKNKRNSRWFEAISPDGEKFIACNRVQFAAKHNLKRVTINQSLLYGYKNRQGWQFRFLTEKEIVDMNLVDRLSSEECND